ncbi:MAG: SpoIIE family protein phosphatase [Lachnospiraceae bacterium]|nr:SpoIIE family protein phosphatase [Lachnospiraceae bacterium]
MSHGETNKGVNMLFRSKVDKSEKKHIEVFDYGKRRLLTYADSFRELAKSFEGPFDYDTQDRQTLLQAKVLWENRRVLCDNLNEMAQIMTRVASEVFRYWPLEERKEKQIVHTFRDEGIVITDLFYIDHPDERKGIGITMYTTGNSTYQTEEVADMLSVLLNERYSVSVVTPSVVDNRVRSYVFVEEAGFVVLTGCAKAVKENETISGDNYTIVESEKGRMTIMLSDGMGSGKIANMSSERVLDLMEKMLEAGYGVDTALNLCNSALVAQGEEQNSSTLDICTLDLHEGHCDLIKAGAAATFIKRGAIVEQISAQSLPLGIFASAEVEVIHRELMDGDYLVMVSDGVLDVFTRNQYEEAVEHFLSGVQDQNPKEIADKLLQFVLHSGGGHIHDDMTILVVGIWENA